LPCPCGANCQPRRLPKWLLAQLDDARSGFYSVSGIETDGFCCPLCVRVLPRACATIAHAPSKEVGGSGRTFLCKACNSFLGTAYEAGADEFMLTLQEGKLTGRTRHRIAANLQTGPRIYLDAIVSGVGAPNSIEAKPRRRNKEAETRFGVAKELGGPLSLAFRVPSESNVRLAYLSWAHLLLFRSLGYAFVFSESGRLARAALLSGSMAQLSRAFFFTYGEFDGQTSPVTTGLLLRSVAPTIEASPPVAVAAEIGRSVISLPLADDPLGRYGQLLDYTSDESRLIVMPFEILFPGLATAMAGVAGIRWRERDGEAHRMLATERGEVRDAVARAKAPPTGRPSRGPLKDNPDWPPAVLPLPPAPRAESWRMTAAGYLNDRGAHPTEPSGDDEAWIGAIRLVDKVAARHVADLRDLFLFGHDPRRRSTEPRGVAVMEELNSVAAEHDPDARVVAGDFRLISPDESYASLSVRLVRGDREIIVGPFYTYETLVFALRMSLNPNRGEPG
jgi:hypothetical protein